MRTGLSGQFCGSALPHQHKPSAAIINPQVRMSNCIEYLLAKPAVGLIGCFQGFLSTDDAKRVQGLLASLGLLECRLDQLARCCFPGLQQQHLLPQSGG